jgi:hypothetical protein
LTPKLPPESGGMRNLSRLPATFRARAITEWMLNGPWKPDRMS